MTQHATIIEQITYVGIYVYVCTYICTSVISHYRMLIILGYPDYGAEMLKEQASSDNLYQNTISIYSMKLEHYVNTSFRVPCHFHIYAAL